MKSLVNFFTPQKSMSLFEEQKTKAFIVLSLVGILLALLTFLQTLFTSSSNNAITIISVASLSSFLILSLFLNKNYGLKIAGNAFSTGITVLLLISMNILKAEITVLYKFTQGFYMILSLVAVGVLFSSRKIVVINSVLVFASTLRIYFYAVEQKPEMKEIFSAAIFNHSISLVVITVVVYYAIAFAENAINSAEKEAVSSRDKNSKLTEAINLIKGTSTVLENLSDEINDLARTLTTGANEQAANVEEISATVEEITSTIVQNSEDANIAAKTVENTAEVVKKSDKAVEKTLSAIQAVSSKIDLINEIARKTNILAINAAIEAARAGDAGRGFSVVANEVKKLADESAVGSKEIIELIDSTIVVSDEAGKMNRIISSDVEKIEKVVGKVSYSSLEMKNSMEQINSAVYQINEGAQQNANISERILALIGEMHNYAQKMNELVAKN